jgi:hypothetical protein
MKKYEVKMDVLRKGKITPEIGKVIILTLDSGQQLDAKIIRVKQDSVIAGAP